MKISSIYTVVTLTTILGVLILGLIHMGARDIKNYRAKEVAVAQSEAPENKNDWKSIENIDMEYDLEKAGVTLIKRSFNDGGEESTYIEYIEDGKTLQRYFYCSRDVHEKLIKKFQEVLQKRTSEWE